ncbi:MAG: hypothetical protein K1X71_13325 [Pirellulales bacterium]|nr:hypothetical protein [Pirellulales bacterium]
MSEFNELTSELQALEAALAGLTPAAGGVDRDRLMYRLGQQSIAPRAVGWRWPLATAALALVAGTLALGLWVNPRERVVYVRTSDLIGDDAAAQASAQQASEPAIAQQPPTTTNPLPSQPWPGASWQVGAWRWSPAALYRAEYAEASWRPARPARERPALRWGDREAWNRLLDETNERPSATTFDKKESA